MLLLTLLVAEYAV